MTIYQTVGRKIWTLRSTVSDWPHENLLEIDCDAEQMMEGLEQVRIAIGSPEQSGISDQEVKDALYYYQYDIDKSVDYLIGMSHYLIIATFGLTSPQRNKRGSRLPRNAKVSVP